ncbi:hypothetical protein MKX03_030794 [Papaver bracteatum]|nr:hypothetical protein MKX03_030794 [Papaver bracteatum]
MSTTSDLRSLVSKKRNKLLFMEMLAKRSVGDLKESDLKGKRVLVRADLNVTLDDYLKISDDSCIKKVLPTIKYLISYGAKVIICSHLGVPGGRKYSLRHLVRRLSELLEVKVVMANGCFGDNVQRLVGGIQNGGVVLLENVRFYKGELRNDPVFARKLASVADLYVNDCFLTAQRTDASSVGVTKFLRPSVAGFLVHKIFFGDLEFSQPSVLCWFSPSPLRFRPNLAIFNTEALPSVDIPRLSRNLTIIGSEVPPTQLSVLNPKKPFAAVVGGGLLSSKLRLIEYLLEKVDILILGGRMISTFNRANGLPVGSSPVEEDMIDAARLVIEKARVKNVALHLPTDVVIADQLAPDANCRTVGAGAIPDGWILMDIGPESIKAFNASMDTSQTVVYQGTMGKSDFDKFAHGTIAIAKKLAEITSKGVTTIIGGGESLADMDRLGLAEKMSHTSTRGKASKLLLEGRLLSGIVALDNVFAV